MTRGRRAADRGDMPEELFFISMAAILCGSGVIVFSVSQIMRYLHARSGITRGGGESSLTTGELERMLGSVVAEANRPLLERVQSVEERLDALPRQLGSGERAPEEAPSSPAEEGAAD